MATQRTRKGKNAGEGEASLGPSGIQALILCGPGASLATFTSSPEESPKALLPIANRPMIWYTLDWTYRMGISNVILITPEISRQTIETALATNPLFTSLPSPKPRVLCPAELTHNNATAEILRMPAVRAAVLGDFLVLPCDLVCEVPGEVLLDAWMVQQGSLAGTTSRSKRRGGLGVWFDTKDSDTIKGQETDFAIMAAGPELMVPPPTGSGLHCLKTLLYNVSTDTLKDILEKDKHLPIRYALLRKHSKIEMLTGHRDAHIYLCPFWTLDLIARNESFFSLGEDVMGWWAKAGWQVGLAKKLGFDGIMEETEDTIADDVGVLEGEIDLMALSSTGYRPQASTSLESFPFPSLHSYVHPSESEQRIRRVDTVHLLLSNSLRLACLPSQEECEASGQQPSPFSHQLKIAYPEGVHKWAKVTKSNCLLADGVTVEAKVVIKECIVGVGCKISSRAQLTRCLLMDGVVIGEGAQLSGCVLGRESRVGKDSMLVDCEVQEGYVIADETDAKKEKFMAFEGLEEGNEDVDEGVIAADDTTDPAITVS